ncbi:hypothetical protein THAOC_00829 [Thalassiosira oceanica]|uniref:Uncharacterized protein n=1 Tax=Thalassiosira oceanica TaxID=159749 RepID=K0TF22_THAOC|nr:hypothetical protein THAOC_00829 [Thalassiosira oceanica]|eukprot:EJK77343.1 hypothetical protein THAOC_00829 [Thalassiosira oceanica]
MWSNAEDVRNYLLENEIVVNIGAAEDMADVLGHLANENARDMLKIGVNSVNDGLSEEGALARILRPVYLWWTSGSTEAHTEATRHFFGFEPFGAVSIPSPEWTYDPTPENDMAMLAMARSGVEPNANDVRTYLLKSPSLTEEWWVSRQARLCLALGQGG